MAAYELTQQQVQNLKALILDANIKGAVAPVIVELLRIFENPVGKDAENDLHGENNSVKSPVRDERQGLPPIPSGRTDNRPGFRLERMVSMKFGKDFFRTLNVVIQMLRMLAILFGDPEDKAAAEESKKRSANSNPDEAV